MPRGAIFAREPLSDKFASELGKRMSIETPQHPVRPV